jgi:adhesin transport system outer membrane protein
MSMAALLQSAVASHPTVSQAQFDVRAAERGVDAARLQFWPTPSLQTETLSGNSAVIAGLSQPLWTGGRLTADLRYSEVLEARAQESVELARLSLALRVATAAQSYFLNKLRREAQERVIATLNDLSAMIQRRTEAEVSAVSDMNLVRSRLGQARSDLAIFQAGEAAALSQLGQALGRPLTGADLALRVPTHPLRVTREALLTRAIDNSPVVRVAQVDLRLAQIEVDRARSALWPTVALRAEHQNGRYEGSAPPGSRVYVSLEYTPGAGFSVGAQIAAAQQRVHAASEAVETVRRDASDRLDSDWRELTAARERLPSLVDARDAAARALESNRRLFIAGRRSWIDLLNSAREVAQAEYAVAEAQSISLGAYYRLAVQSGVNTWTAEGLTLQ